MNLQSILYWLENFPTHCHHLMCSLLLFISVFVKMCVCFAFAEARSIFSNYFQLKLINFLDSDQRKNVANEHPATFHRPIVTAMLFFSAENCFAFSSSETIHKYFHSFLPGCELFYKFSICTKFSIKINTKKTSKINKIFF